MRGIAAAAGVSLADRLLAAAESHDVRVPDGLAPYLPMQLWLHQMALILYWVYDRPPGQRQTRTLREKSRALLVSGLKISRFALLRQVRSKIVELIVVAKGGTNRDAAEDAWSKTDPCLDRAGLVVPGIVVQAAEWSAEPEGGSGDGAIHWRRGSARCADRAGPH